MSTITTRCYCTKCPHVGNKLEYNGDLVLVTRVYGRGESLVIENSLGVTKLICREDADLWQVSA